MNASREFLNLFWDLAADDSEKRVIAGKNIIAHILPSSGAANQLELTDYTLKRLVKGLGSSRECARLGFAACLTDFLVHIRSVETTSVLSLLDEHTKVSRIIHFLLVGFVD